jgi:hypothetical protein
MHKRFVDVWYSFPIQLFLLHIRSNQLLLALWIILAMFVSGDIGQKLGFRYLFLDPEYLGAVNFWSFFFLGFTFGGFTMTWHLTTYLLSAHYFPFLASLSRPFTKFCINNAIFPAGFLIFYLATLIVFQYRYEDLTGGTILLNCLGVLAGAFLLIIFNLLYFYFTNKDIFHFLKVNKKLLPPDLIPQIAPGRRGVDLDSIKLDENRWLVSTYFTETLGVRAVRSVAHYDSKLLMNIFQQNHLNALIIQLFSMILLMLLGQLIDYTYFRIPAAASLFILGSVILAILGALIYWFDQWWITLFIILLGIINYITSFEFLHFNNRAYGLNYEVPRAEYAYKKLEKLVQSEQVQVDKANTIKVLENWRRKVKRPGRKPKLVLLCVSGGGLRAATWTVQSLQTADSLTNGKLLDHSVLITGASGGMFGAAYLRELQLQKKLQQTVDLYADIHTENVSKDLLNSVAFTLVTNDLFLPWSTFESGEYRYQKDRGYTFEKQLNENTGQILNKSLNDYREPEAQGLIPMMYITPSIVNDVRRMIISPQGVSFMMVPPVGNANLQAVEVDAVDFGWLFRNQNAYNLRFLTALRMNATYPYVLPSVHLPSTPGVEVLDAGFRDNYGTNSAVRFLHVFKDWIQENTSGVLMVQISSSEKIEETYPSNTQGLISSLLNPVGIAGQLIVFQEFEHDNAIALMYELFGKNRFEFIRLVYSPGADAKVRAAISFHLTNGERENVLNAIHLPENQTNLRRLVKALQ